MPANDPNSPVAPQGIQRGAAPPTFDRRASTWYVGPRQLIAAIVGIVLYVPASHVNLIILIPGGTPDVFLPALLIPLFFGVIYGSWVGLVVGGFGFLLGDYVANVWLHDLSGNTGYLFYASTLVNRDLIGWNGILGYLCSALMGLVAGLARIGYRRYNSFHALATAGVICAAGSTIAIAIVAYSTVWIYNSPFYTLSDATIAFFDSTLTNLLVVLVVLPVLLFLYDLAAWGRKRA
ncbi:MAG TPA: hypothetical protein VKR83_14560 [Ktedonobacteraceae bacterium]|nr:hypothetical protein [Ktedonobacteraceae bacterium]